MKSLTLTLMSGLFLAIVSTSSLSAQNSIEYTSYLRIVEPESFNKVKLSMDTNVIFKKSKETRITLAGDSAFIANIPVGVDSETLTINYQREPANRLYQVVIEYTRLDSAQTEGNGMYYFDQIDQENLSILNPEAKVVVKGKADSIRIVSRKGVNDVSGLKADKMIFRLGETATLLNSNDTLLSSLDWY